MRCSCDVECETGGRYASCGCCGGDGNGLEGVCGGDVGAAAAAFVVPGVVESVENFVDLKKAGLLNLAENDDAGCCCCFCSSAGNCDFDLCTCVNNCDR